MKSDRSMGVESRMSTGRDEKHGSSLGPRIKLDPGHKRHVHQPSSCLAEPGDGDGWWVLENIHQVHLGQ